MIQKITQQLHFHRAFSCLGPTVCLTFSKASKIDKTSVVKQFQARNKKPEADHAWHQTSTEKRFFFVFKINKKSTRKTVMFMLHFTSSLFGLIFSFVWYPRMNFDFSSVARFELEEREKQTFCYRKTLSMSILFIFRGIYWDWSFYAASMQLHCFISGVLYSPDIRKLSMTN